MRPSLYKIKKEVRELIQKYGRGIAPFSVVGYREIADYLDGNIDESMMRDMLKPSARSETTQAHCFGWESLVEFLAAILDGHPSHGVSVERVVNKQDRVGLPVLCAYNVV